MRPIFDIIYVFHNNKMKKLLFIFLFILAGGMAFVNLTSCKSEKNADNAETDSIDSLAKDSATIDTATIVDNTPVSDTEKYIDSRPMPKAADELFDDFFFAFSNSRKIQKERIVWPLKLIVNETAEEMPENHWQMERFYADEGFYVLLLDDERQLKLAKDTAVHNVVVKHVNIGNNHLKNFKFNKIEGKWMMTEIEEESLSDSKNASFLRFYQHFATDSIYCLESIEDSIKFTGPDIVDENLTTTRYIFAEEYFDWAPELATNFYAVTYGQKENSSNNKVFIMRQPASSQECRLYFRRRGSSWKLYRLVE